MRKKSKREILRPSVSIIDERSFQCPGIVLISAALAALAAGLTTQVGGQGPYVQVMLTPALRRLYISKTTHYSTLLAPVTVVMSKSYVIILNATNPNPTPC